MSLALPALRLVSRTSVQCGGQELVRSLARCLTTKGLSGVVTIPQCHLRLGSIHISGRCATVGYVEISLDIF